MRTLTGGEVAAHVGRIDEQGFTVIEDAVEPDLVEELTETLERLERDLAVTPAGNSFEGRNIWRVYNLLVHGDVFARVRVHPDVLPVVEGVLDPGRSAKARASAVTTVRAEARAVAAMMRSLAPRGRPRDRTGPAAPRARSRSPGRSRARGCGRRRRRRRRDERPDADRQPAGHRPAARRR